MPLFFSNYSLVGTQNWDLSQILFEQKSAKPATVHGIGTKSYTFASQFQVKQQYNKTGFQLTRPEAGHTVILAIF